MRTETFICRVRIAVSAEEAFAWHARYGALERLTPPWEKFRDVAISGPFLSWNHLQRRMRSWQSIMP